MPEIDLSSLKEFAEEQMTDEVKITRDPEGSTDDVLDEGTGVYTPPTFDTVTVYQGPALIIPINVFPSSATEGGGTVSRTDYELHIPLESPTVNDLDDVIVTKSLRNYRLVNQEFKVRDVETGSTTVTQKSRIVKRVVTAVL